MQPNTGIDLDDLFGTKPPAPQAPSGAAEDLPPPPYEGPTSTIPAFSPPPPPSQSQPSYENMQWQAPPPQQHQQQHQQPQQAFSPHAQSYHQAVSSPPLPAQNSYQTPQGYYAAPPTTAGAYPTAPYTSPYPTGMASPMPTQPTQPSPVATPGPAVSTTSAEDDDRAQLEKIIRLRRELEQEQERERQKREELQTWGCAQCTYRNPLQGTACAMCGLARPGYTTTGSHNTSATATTSTTATTTAAPSAPPRMAGATAWQCSICLAPNEANNTRCQVCQAFQASGTPIAATGPPSGGAPAPAPSSTSNWMCSVCGQVNPPSAANCRVCHGYQRNGTPVAGNGPTTTTTTAAITTAASSAGVPSPAAATWACSVCTFENPISAALCEACRTGKRPPHLDHAATTRPKGGASAGESGDAKKKTWPCPTCTFMNKMRRSKCDMCGSARPATYAQEKAATDRGEKKREEQSDDDEVQWQDDNVAKACNRCHQEFGMMRRRHHCRKCGYVFCATCSPFYILNKKTSMQERVCVNCYEAQKDKK